MIIIIIIISKFIGHKCTWCNCKCRRGAKPLNVLESAHQVWDKGQKQTRPDPGLRLVWGRAVGKAGSCNLRRYGEALAHATYAGMVKG